MRLALFTDTYAPQMNGVSRTLGRLVDAVQGSGGEARVFTTTDPRVDTSRPTAHAERRWPSVQCPLYQELRLSAPTQRSVRDALDEFAPTLVHAATPFGLGLSARKAARTMQLPFVTSYHTSFSAYARFYGMRLLEDPIWRTLRWFHNGGRRTYCPTDAVRRELAGRGFERLAVWGRGVDRARFCPGKRSRTMRQRMGATDGTVVVAYVGRIAREKGLDHVLGAMPLVDPVTSGAVFAFAGDGPYLDHCRANAPASCSFLGRLEGEELAAFYASADVFLFPSTTDTFGNVLLEAMSAGLPILAADSPPSREIARDAAIWYPHGHATALALSITALALDANARARHATASARRATDYTWDAVFSGLLADYAAVVQESSDSAPSDSIVRAAALDPVDAGITA